MRPTTLLLLPALALSLAAQQPISTENAEHYTWGDCCDGWYLTKSPDLHVIQERLPPGSGEKLHYHTKALQFFYVLQGDARFELDGRSVDVPTGKGLPIPPGTKHRVANAGRTDLIILVISQPPSQGDRVDVP